MRKLFSLLAAVLFAGSMMAGTATLTIENFAATSFTDQASGISVTTAKNGGGTEPAYNATGKDLRVYAKGSVTIEAAQNITAISFTISTQGKRRLAPLTANVGEVAVAGTPDFTAEWTGSATSVTITVGDKADYGTDGNTKAGQLDFTAIVVTFDGEGGGDPIVVVYDTINVAEAIVIANALENGETSADKYFVEGFAVNVAAYSSEYKNQDFFMVDNATAPDSVLMAFRAAPKKAGQAYPVLAGDKVLAFGKLKKYVNKNDVVQLEIDQPSVEFLEEVEGDRTIEEPEPVVPDTITVARALAIGDSIGQGKTTAEQYVVDGYVISAEAFYQANKNQTWTMADDAAAESATFKAYRCVPVFNNDTVKVLKGDKVRLCGKIQNYNGTIEISYAKAEFLSMAEGDHSTAETVQEVFDTITVKRALEIGAALASGATTDSTYVIGGYVSNIVQYFDTTYKNETFWMVDTMGQRAATNAAGAFEVYRGVPTPAQEIGLDAFVYVTSKIQNYQGKTIETSGTPAVNVVIPGTIEEVPVINVDSALKIGKALADGGISELRYEITGYVSNVYTFFNPDFNNETVWITDDPTSTSADKANAFEIYRGKPSTQAEVGWGAKVKIVCKITNYKGTIENSGANITFEVLEPSTFVPDTVTIEDAIAMTANLADGEKLATYSVVKGFVRTVTTPYDAQKNTASFELADYATGPAELATAYQATILKADAEKVAAGSYAVVTGYLMKHGSATQIAQGAITAFEEAPTFDTIYATPSQAQEAGMALEDNKRTQNVYVVTGYVVSANSYDPEDDDFQTFLMADEKGGQAIFKALNAKVPGNGVKVGDQVTLTGNVFKYVEGADISIYIQNGEVAIIPAEGIENVVLTEEIQKVIVDGVLYIIRDGKMFNAQGVQVR